MEKNGEEERGVPVYENKPGLAGIEGYSTPTPSDDTLSTPGFDLIRTKQLVRKLDWHLVPFLALLYL
jgi:hypothetical protein